MAFSLYLAETRGLSLNLELARRLRHDIKRRALHQNDLKHQAEWCSPHVLWPFGPQDALMRYGYCYTAASAGSCVRIAARGYGLYCRLAYVFD